MNASRLDELRGDYHVHSTFSDDAGSTIQENVSAAAAQGLQHLRLVEHVRRSTTWIPEFLTAVSRARIPDGLTVLNGVEAKILDSRGTLDLPKDLIVGPGNVGAILIADHQFPGLGGPWSPSETRRRLDAGLAVADALDLLVGATIAAMGSVPSAQLAHCFSILPKIGLSEDDLGDDQLAAWANAAAASGTLIEVNEKWGCPGPRALAAARQAAVIVVASTDSHLAKDIGHYEKVIELLTEAEAS